MIINNNLKTLILITMKRKSKNRQNYHKIKLNFKFSSICTYVFIGYCKKRCYFKKMKTCTIKNGYVRNEIKIESL